ncbi:15764_t:CDS:2, partial [Gigaspora rosea]
MTLLCEPTELYLELIIEYLAVHLRPHTVKSTGTRPISEVKPLMVQSVLWLGTTWEYWVP